MILLLFLFIFPSKFYPIYLDTPKKIEAFKMFLSIRMWLLTLWFRYVWFLSIVWYSIQSHILWRDTHYRHDITHIQGFLILSIDFTTVWLVIDWSSIESELKINNKQINQIGTRLSTLISFIENPIMLMLVFPIFTRCHHHNLISWSHNTLCIFFIPQK